MSENHFIPKHKLFDCSLMMMLRRQDLDTGTA